MDPALLEQRLDAISIIKVRSFHCDRSQALQEHVVEKLTLNLGQIAWGSERVGLWNACCPVRLLAGGRSRLCLAGPYCIIHRTFINLVLHDGS